MQTLTYGLKKPETGDKGDVFFTALEDNIDQIDDHSHNGVNSAKLASSSVTANTVSVLSGSWSDQGSGTYRQLVTMPGAMLFDQHKVQVRLSSGHVIFPTIEKVSSTTFYIYVNDNSLNLTVLV